MRPSGLWTRAERLTPMARQVTDPSTHRRSGETQSGGTESRDEANGPTSRGWQTRRSIPTIKAKPSDDRQASTNGGSARLLTDKSAAASEEGVTDETARGGSPTSAWKGGSVVRTLRPTVVGNRRSHRPQQSACSLLT
jgi:hypothetical protein